MIAVFSTSSPLTSVALLDGDVVHAVERHAPMQSSGAAMALLAELLDRRGIRIDEVEGFVADVGPGGFTGVRVGVTIAKSLGFLHGRPVAGVSAFDLIAPDQTVAVPAKKGEYFVREPGAEPARRAGKPPEAVGYGPDFADPRFPHALRIAAQLPNLEWLPAERLVPHYGMEPSISLPKKPFGLPAERP